MQGALAASRTDGEERAWAVLILEHYRDAPAQEVDLLDHMDGHDAFLAREKGTACDGAGNEGGLNIEPSTGEREFLLRRLAPTPSRCNVDTVFTPSTQSTSKNDRRIARGAGSNVSGPFPTRPPGLSTRSGVRRGTAASPLVRMASRPRSCPAHTAVRGCGSRRALATAPCPRLRGPLSHYATQPIIFPSHIHRSRTTPPQDGPESAPSRHQTVRTPEGLFRFAGALTFGHGTTLSLFCLPSTVYHPL